MELTETQGAMPRIGDKAPEFKAITTQGDINFPKDGEYGSGHIRGSINISVDTLSNNLGKLKDKNKPIITCCASGMRSAQAKSILKANGFSEVHNGGGWSNLKNKIN